MSQDEGLTKALEKIRKCLALSKSANEHEAATALRQAHALMRQFDLTQSGVLASTVNRASTKSGAKSRISRWDQALVQCIARQFECELLVFRPLYEQTQWEFLGVGQAPEIAAYAYTVLYRQLIATKERFIASKFPRAVAGEKRKLGELFCFGWVQAVSKIVADFASADKTQQSEALSAYMHAHHPDIKQRKSAKARKRVVSGVEYRAYQLGLEQGGAVKLHRGLDGAKQTLIEHEQTDS